jgi:hypothetical protein
MAVNSSIENSNKIVTQHDFYKTMCEFVYGATQTDTTIEKEANIMSTVLENWEENGSYDKNKALVNMSGPVVDEGYFWGKCKESGCFSGKAILDTTISYPITFDSSLQSKQLVPGNKINTPFTSHFALNDWLKDNFTVTFYSNDIFFDEMASGETITIEKLELGFSDSNVIFRGQGNQIVPSVLTTYNYKPYSASVVSLGDTFNSAFLCLYGTIYNSAKWCISGKIIISVTGATGTDTKTITVTPSSLPVSGITSFSGGQFPISSPTNFPTKININFPLVRNTYFSCISISNIINTTITNATGLTYATIVNAGNYENSIGIVYKNIGCNINCFGYDRTTKTIESVSLGVSGEVRKENATEIYIPTNYSTTSTLSPVIQLQNGMLLCCEQVNVQGAAGTPTLTWSNFKGTNNKIFTAISSKTYLSICSKIQFIVKTSQCRSITIREDMASTSATSYTWRGTGQSTVDPCRLGPSLLLKINHNIGALQTILVSFKIGDVFKTVNVISSQNGSEINVKFLDDYPNHLVYGGTLVVTVNLMG